MYRNWRMIQLQENSGILRLEHIYKEFELKDDQTLKAVNDVSLIVKKGECVAVVGESGCGKSTLAKLVTYIENVTEGKIFFDGKEMTNIRGNELREYRRQVQMIFQDPSNVFSPRMKIGTFLMEPWRNFEKKSRKDAKEEAFKALHQVKLGREYFRKYPHQLSGGELQRISIARAIALRPQLLICDEATSALDVSIQMQIVNLLKESQKENNYAILFISHDLALAENFSDRVVVMYLGRIVEILKGSALRKNARHPYTRALLESDFSVRDNQQEEIKILPGEPPSPVQLPPGCAFCDRGKYAMEICRKKVPDLRNIDEIHQVACHLDFDRLSLDKVYNFCKNT